MSAKFGRNAYSTKWDHRQKRCVIFFETEVPKKNCLRIIHVPVIYLIGFGSLINDNPVNRSGLRPTCVYVLYMCVYIEYIHDIGTSNDSQLIITSAYLHRKMSIAKKTASSKKRQNSFFILKLNTLYTWYIMVVFSSLERERERVSEVPHKSVPIFYRVTRF